MLKTAIRALLVSAGLLPTIVPIAAGGPVAEATFPGNDGVLALVAGGPPNGVPDIWTTDLSTTTTDITNSAKAAESAPSYSADGRHIVYTRNNNIWVMGAGGGNQTRLTTGGSLHLYARPTFTPDNRIVFESDQGLTIMRMDGTHRRLIGVNGTSPTVSPSGHWVAYSRTLKSTGETHVFKAHLDGTQVTDLTKTATNASDPDWGPNGHLILYIDADGAGTWSLATMRTDGTHKQHVYSSPDILSTPVFSPSMFAIAFTDNESSGHLFVKVDESGTISKATESDSLQPAWRPTP